MGFTAQLQPRHPAVAARLAVGFTAAAALVQLAQTLATPLDGGVTGIALSYGVPVALMVLSLIALLDVDRVPTLVWGVFPVLGLAVIVALDVTSRDASVLAQVFLFFPVLFAASQLPRAGGLAILGLAAVGDAVATFSSEPAPIAAFETAVVVVAMITATLLLQHSNAEHDRLVERLARLARVDALTGVLARRPFDEETGTALRSPHPDGREHPGTAMLVVDLDLFKQVNDRYGHPVGDDLLVHAAQFLADRCRRGDVVGRLGGDEFAVLLPACRYEDAVTRAAGLVEAAAGAPLVLATGEVVPLRLTIGVGHVDHGSCDEGRVLYSHADEALYRAKRAGRGRYA